MCCPIALPPGPCPTPHPPDAPISRFTLPSSRFQFQSQLPGKPFLSPGTGSQTHGAVVLGPAQRPRHMCLNGQRADISRRRQGQREGRGETEATHLVSSRSSCITRVSQRRTFLHPQTWFHKSLHGAQACPAGLTLPNSQCWASGLRG